MNPIYYDLETVSLHSMCVLIQYAIGEGEVILYEPWRRPIRETLDLIERFMSHEDGVVGFNMAFDHFHLCKLWNTFNLYVEKGGSDQELPVNIINELGVLEKEARDGKCLKPKSCFDILLYSRKGPYQSCMERKPIIIKKVPTLLAYKLADYLEKKIKLKDIYFAKRKNKYEPKWKVEAFEYKDGTIDNDFKNIVLRFNASNALKALAHDALGIDKNDILLYGEITIDPGLIPEEDKCDFGYAPFALAVAPNYLNEESEDYGNWKGSWPQVIRHHIQHWHTNTLARKYARDDVIYTRSLYHYFDDPPMNDNDSILACLVATCRWKGFAIDVEAIKKLRDEAITLSTSAPTAPEAVREYIYSHLSETERVVLTESSKHKLQETTKKVALEEISKQTQECDCVRSVTVGEIGTDIGESFGYESDPKHDCSKCNGTGVYRTKAAKLASNVLKARLANYEINFYNKLLLAGRLHASFNVIGTLSSRMSGSGGGLNTQGIKTDKEVRACFLIAWPPYVFCGGDFVSFEVVIAEAKYNDPELRKALQTVITCPFCEGSLKCKGCDGRGCDKCKEKGICLECKGTGTHRQTIHGLFGTFMYPGMSYVDILRTKGLGGMNDKYVQGKRGVFLNMYGGTGFAMEDRIGIPREVGDRAVEGFNRRFKQVGENNKRIENMFQAMRQPNGIGTKVEWHNPADYIESMFGFRRYFTLENNICKALFEIAENPPEEWLKLKIKTVRRDREQTVGGAVRSALFACAFNIQGQNVRAARNHVIQSSGATLTKGLQSKIWGLQPSGIHDWIISSMNIHDELLSFTLPDYIHKLEEIVKQFVEENKKTIPLLEIDWKSGMKNWGEK